MIESLILFVYIIGWMYTSYLFWKYGVKHGSGSIFRPIPAATILALSWPLLFCLTLFMKDKEHGKV